MQTNVLSTPALLENFFNYGQEESTSPFLEPASRKWSQNLPLKSSLISAFFLVLSFILTFIPQAVPLSYFFLALVYFIAGTPSLIEAVEELSEFNLNIDILMTFAAFSSILIGNGMEGGLLLVLFSLSGSLEEFVSGKAKNSINALHALSPDKAFVVDTQGKILEKAVRDIEIGSKILVKAGQIVPLDGVVIEGSSSLNLSHLTGESVPVNKKKGDCVPSGAKNLEGALTLEVTHTSLNSTLSQIINLVTQAQEVKPKLQTFFDRTAQKYTLSVIGLTVLFVVLLPLLWAIPVFGTEGSLYRSLSFLVAASPCALIIALPIAYLSAISSCAKHGLLIKGGTILDALASCKKIAFDKTGTLTTGKLICTRFECLDPCPPELLSQALSVAAAMEKNAIHPIAQAILNLAEKRKAPPLALENFVSIPGSGLRASCEDSEAYIGSKEFISPLLPEDKVSLLQDLRKGVFTLLWWKKHLFIFAFADEIRSNSHTVVQKLQHQNMQILMLSGDLESNAASAAKQLGITDYYGNLKPEDKLRMVSDLSKKGLIMVGDGINDAPAIARATVGVCMGKIGNHATVDAADIILLDDNLEKLAWILDKSKKTQKIVRQNLWIAGAAILCASIPALCGAVPLWMAVILHEGGTLLVGLNALRLLK